jgi:hypothetical protein
MSSVRPPSQFLIINDKTFVSAELQNLTSFNKLKIDSAYASNDNNGNLSLFCIDNEPESQSNFEFRVQNSGSLGESAYIWRNTLANQDTWYGENDRRFMTSVENADITTKAYNPTGLYSHKNKRIMLYYGKSDGVIGIHWKNLSRADEYNAWATDQFDFNDSADNFGADNLVSQLGVLDVVELPNEKILMVVNYERDLYLYISSDGLQFEVYSPAILSRFTSIENNVSNVKIACSGNYVRIVGVIESLLGNNSETRMFSIVSPDRGSTWIENESNIYVYQKESTGDDRFSFDLVNFDENGTFILTSLGIETRRRDGVILDVNRDAYRSYLATSTSEFSYTPNLYIDGTFSPQQVYLCNHSDVIIAIIVCCSTRNDIKPDPSTTIQSSIGNAIVNQTIISINSFEYQFFYIDKSSNVSSVSWENLNKGYAITGFLGSARLLPAKGKMFSSTAGFHLFNAIRDKELPMQLAYMDGGAFSSFGTWSSRPYNDKNVGNFSGNRIISDYPTNHHQPAGRALSPQWTSHIGTPEGGMNGCFGEKESVWKQRRSSVGTYGSWDSDGYKVRGLSNAVSGDEYYFEYIDPKFYDLKDSRALRSQLVLRVKYTGTDLATAVTTYGDTFLNREESPDRNWCFVPYSDGRANKYYKNNPHGSCIIWEAKFDQGLVDPINSDAMILGLKSYGELFSGSVVGSSLYSLDLVVRHSETKLVIYDNISSAPLATITPDTGVYGSTPFKTDYWEFRWSWYPISTEYISGTSSTTQTQCVLMCRKTGSTQWLSTDMIQNPHHLNTSTTDILTQKLYFGSLTGLTNSVSYWKRVGVHTNNDLGTFGYEGANIAPITNMNSLDAIRGRVASDNPDIFDSESTTKVVWGGASGHYNDRYFADMTYDYPPTNINQHQSPRVQYRGKSTLVSVANDPEIIFKSANDDLFYHDAMSIINTNVREIEVSYSMNNSSYGAVQTISMERISNGRVDSVSGNAIEVSFDSDDLLHGEINSTQYKKYYMRTDVSTAVASTYIFEVKNLYKNGSSNVFLINTDNVSSSIPSGLVGSTISIFSDRGYIKNYQDSGDVSLYGKYMKLTLKKANETAEGYGYLGSIVTGKRFDFDVPLSWEYSDTQKANQTRFRTRSGIQWAYNQGSAERQIQVRMIGDVTNQDRRELREELNSVGGYGENNMVFITETTGKDREMIFHCIPTEENAMQNQGWYYDETHQKWYPVGDLDITLIEVT